MTALTIDTLDLANRLKEAGTGDRQAEVMAGAIAHGLARSGGELVTKTDLTADLAKLETRLTNRIYGVAGLILLAVLLRPALDLL